MEATRNVLTIDQDEWGQVQEELRVLKEERVEVARMEKWFGLITENVADLFAIVDGKSKKNWAEISAETFSDFSPLVLEGSYATGQVYTEDRRVLIALLEDSLRTGIGQRVRLRMRGVSGDLAWLEVQTRVVTDNQGVVEYLVLIANEIGDLLKQELEIAKAKSSQAVSHFAKGLENDLQGRLNHLGRCLSGAETAGEARGGEEVRKQVKEARDVFEEVKEVLHSIHGLTYAEPKQLEVVDLNGLLKKLLEEIPFGKGVETSFHSIAKSARALGSEEMLIKAFKHLLHNASEALQGKGTISVDIGKVTFELRSPNRPPQLSPRDYLRVTISDDGVGISEEIRTKIFDPYISTKPKRRGLGLASALNMVSRHKGTITVESNEAGGTSFHVYLPSYSQDTGKKKLVAEEKDKPKKIILMDDDALVRKFVARLLVTLGYIVTPAAEGKEVLELYRQALDAGDSFDAVVMDLMIPAGMGGEMTIQWLRKLDEKVVAIASSGQTDSPVMIDPKAHGFSAAIAKPYNRERLGAVLAKALTK